MFRKPVLFILSCSLILPLFAQLTDQQTQKLDSIFLSWNQPNHPGGVVGVRKGSENVYLKAFGLASLDYLVPNQTATLFNLASVSKQFTAMGILILEKEGKLSVDDKISQYIPNLTDIGDKITIRHMLHHTSGIRSFHELLYYAGWRWGDYRSNEDIYRLMESQQDLNFEPGSQYMYCNTGYLYMAYIIEKLTGEAFPYWMKKHVFEPLGMRDTYVEDNISRVVPHNATSYFGNSEEGFQRSIDYWAYVGSGNMHATAADLLIWGAHFYNPKEGWGDLFQRLQEVDPFNDGTPNNYAFGVNVNEVRGMTSIAHGGSIGGFRSNLVVIPEEELVITILTNYSRANPGGKTYEVFEIVAEGLAEDSGQQEVQEDPAVIQLSASKLKSFEHSWWNVRDKFMRRTYVKNDTLMYWRGENNESPMVPIGKREFKLLEVDGRDLRVKFEVKGSHAEMVMTEPGRLPWEFDGFAATEGTPQEWKGYVGQYYSPELEVVYEFRWQDDQLVAYHQRHGYYALERVKKDVLDAGNFVAEFQRDKAGKVTGVLFSSGRVRNLRLEKR